MGCLDDGRTFFVSGCSPWITVKKLVCHFTKSSYCFRVGNYCIFVMLPKLNTAETNYFLLHCATMMWDCTEEQMEARWAFGPYSARSIRWKVGHSVADRKREEKEFSWWLRQKYPPETRTEINNPVSSYCVYIHWCGISKHTDKVSHIVFVRFLILNQNWNYSVHSVLHKWGIICSTTEQLEYLRLCNSIIFFSEELLINEFLPTATHINVP